MGSENGCIKKGSSTSVNFMLWGNFGTLICSRTIYFSLSLLFSLNDDDQDALSPNSPESENLATTSSAIHQGCSTPMRGGVIIMSHRISSDFMLCLLCLAIHTASEKFTLLAALFRSVLLLNPQNGLLSTEMRLLRISRCGKQIISILSGILCE